MHTSSIVSLVTHASQYAGGDICQQTLDVIRRYSEAFNRAGASEDTRQYLVTFYAKVPESHRFINYVDVKHDHWDYDYTYILRKYVEFASRSNPRAQILIITDEHTDLGDLSASVQVVRLPIRSSDLMYERALAMLAFVKSELFSKDATFTDTDVIVLKDLSEIFIDDFDVGVCIRDVENFYMPINEGVIFASHSNQEAVVRFFEDYVATYDFLLKDASILSYYGNIKRWRGGQLSLNAIVAARGHIASIAGRLHDGVDIRVMDCKEFNFCIDQDEKKDIRIWLQKPILHFKGASKSRFQEYMLSLEMSAQPPTPDTNLMRGGLIEKSLI